MSSRTVRLVYTGGSNRRDRDRSRSSSRDRGREKKRRKRSRSRSRGRSRGSFSRDDRGSSDGYSDSYGMHESNSGHGRNYTSRNFRDEQWTERSGRDRKSSRGSGSMPFLGVPGIPIPPHLLHQRMMAGEHMMAANTPSPMSPMMRSAAAATMSPFADPRDVHPRDRRSSFEADEWQDRRRRSSRGASEEAGINSSSHNSHPVDAARPVMIRIAASGGVLLHVLLLPLLLAVNIYNDNAHRHYTLLLHLRLQT